MGVLRLGRVAEHHRHRRKHLGRYAVPVAIFQPPDGIPAVVVDLTETLTIEHHAGAAGTVMLQLHETAAAVTRAQIGPTFRQNVRVQVDFHGCGIPDIPYPAANAAGSPCPANRLR